MCTNYEFLNFEKCANLEKLIDIDLTNRLIAISDRAENCAFSLYIWILDKGS